MINKDNKQINLNNVKSVHQLYLTIVLSPDYRCWINIRALVHNNPVNLDSQVFLVFVLDSLGFQDPFNTSDLAGQAMTRHSFKVGTLAQNVRLEFLMSGDTNVTLTQRLYKNMV